MGAPESGLEAAGQATAETLLTAFRTIKEPERARHATVLDYWLSIRGDKEFPPLHDLDPLEISDAGPSSILLELIGGGQDAEIRHLGEALQDDTAVQRIIDAPNPSILGSIAKKLPIVAISRDFLAFEDSFSTTDGLTRCWVTLLPLSSCGSWVDYVYAFVSVEGPARTERVREPEPASPEEAAMEPPELAAEPETAAGMVPFAAEEPEAPGVEPAEAIHEPETAQDAETASGKGPGFSKLLEGFASLTGFYGQAIKAEDVVQAELPAEEVAAAEPATVAEPEPEPEPVADEPLAEPEELVLEIEAQEIAVEGPPPVEETATEDEPWPAPEPVAPDLGPVMEGTLQSKLAEVQAKADEAREAQLRATQALHQGLSAAYDFALDAETCPEEYLRLVEAKGMKIQLRAPMAPVAKLAFDEVCDPATIRQFEAVLAWALKVELPRGALLERIEQAGGIPELLNEFARAA